MVDGNSVTPSRQGTVKRASIPMSYDGAGVSRYMPRSSLTMAFAR